MQAAFLSVTRRSPPRSAATMSASKRSCVMRIGHFLSASMNNFQNSFLRNNFSSTSSVYLKNDYNSKLSLRKVIRPFLRACHPDAMITSLDLMESNDGQNIDGTLIRKSKHSLSLSQQAKHINLKAVQTLNGLIDVCEDLIHRCTPQSFASKPATSASRANTTSIPELKSHYQIEFILPSSSIANSIKQSPNYPLPIKKKRNSQKEPLSIRSITIEFPSDLRTSARKWALTPFNVVSSSSSPSEYELQLEKQNEAAAFRIAMQLKHHAYSEFARLLTVAGMETHLSPSDNLQSHQRDNRTKDPNEWTLSDHFLHELGIDPTEEETPPTYSSDYISSVLHPSQSAAFFGRGTHFSPGEEPPPPIYSHPQLRKQRQAFMNSIPWDKFSQDYDQAFLDAKANWTTSRMKFFNTKTQEGRERRERFVSQICGSVRISTGVELGILNEGNEEEEDPFPEDLNIVQQLIAIRRLSLILLDNFDYLQLEQMGRMWENLVIVLTPPRQYGRRRLNRIETVNKELGTYRNNQYVSFQRNHSPHPGRKLKKWERTIKRRDKSKFPNENVFVRVVEPNLSTLENSKHEGSKDNHDNVEFSSNPESTESSGPSFQSQSSRHSRAVESGFKFSYGTQSDQKSGQVTAYIPIDFRDEELVKQLYTHLNDYFGICCRDMGFFKYTADGNIVANIVGTK